MRDRFAGTPIKNVSITYANNKVRGELMISKEGIEGGAIYALSGLGTLGIDAQRGQILRRERHAGARDGRCRGNQHARVVT